MTLKNQTEEEKTLKVFSFAEWCLWNAATDMENFQRNFSTGEVEVEGSTIYHKTEYRERRNHYAFYTVNTEIQGYDTDRESFIGLYNEFAEPEAVMEASHATALPTAGALSHLIISRLPCSQARAATSSSCWAMWRTNRTRSSAPRR